MEIEKNISWGNIVSWTVIIIGLAAGYGKMSSAIQQTQKDVLEAKEMAVRVEKRQKESDDIRATQINEIKVAVAETRITVFYIDKKLDDLLRNTRGLSSTNP